MAYGALVFALGAAAYMIWRRKNELEERHYDFLSKVLGVMQMVETKMETIAPVQNDIKDLQRDVKTLEEKVDDLQDNIDDLK